MRGKWRAWSAGESKTDSEKERGRRKSTGTGKKNGRGKRGEGGPVGERLRKEGRLDRNWQNRGKKEKKQNSRITRNRTSVRTVSYALWSPLIFVF